MLFKQLVRSFIITDIISLHKSRTSMSQNCSVLMRKMRKQMKMKFMHQRVRNLDLQRSIYVNANIYCLIEKRSVTFNIKRHFSKR